MSMNDELSEMFNTDLEQQLEQSEANADDLVAFLANRIDELLRGNFDGLMSMMYRLDVDETKIRIALSPDNPEAAATGLAKLIIERQQQRMHTKKMYSQSSQDDWIDLS